MTRMRIIFILIMSMVLCATGVMAQDNATCSPLVQQALSALGDHCDALDRNSACYGFNRVDARFRQEHAEGFFSHPSDRTPLIDLMSIKTQPFQSQLAEWGIAVMNVQANLPGTLPGQAVTFLLLGDSELENGVAPEDVTAPGDAYTVMTRAQVNLRSGPGTQYNVIDTAPSGDMLYVDGFDDSRGWLRVVSGGRITWVSAEFVESTEPGGLSHLPTINQQTRSTMQAFTFRTGFSGVECEDVPPASLVIQGPENFTVNVNANGTEIQLGSTIVLLMTEDGLLQLITLDGTAQINGVNIHAGYTMFARVDENGQVIGNWFGARPATFDELAQFRSLEYVSGEILSYEIVIPPPGTPPQTTITITNEDGTVTVSGPQCAGFVPTSPLHPVSGGQQAFYWDAASGAEGGYRLVLLAEDNSVINTVSVPAGVTTQTVNLSEYRGGNLNWEVHALNSAGEVLCTTSRVANAFSPAYIPPRELTYAERCAAAGGVVMTGPSCYVIGTGFITP